MLWKKQQQQNTGSPAASKLLDLLLQINLSRQGPIWEKTHS